jgi:hypothetical protein
MEHEGYTYIFLTGQRKNFHHDVPSSWTCVAYERFDYVECGVYRKKITDLDAEDSNWTKYYSEPGEDFIDPSDWKWPRRAEDVAAEVEAKALDDLTARIRKWQDEHDRRPSEVVAALIKMMEYFRPKTGRSDQ